MRGPFGSHSIMFSTKASNISESKTTTHLVSLNKCITSFYLNSDLKFHGKDLQMFEFTFTTLLMKMFIKSIKILKLENTPTKDKTIFFSYGGKYNVSVSNRNELRSTSLNCTNTHLHQNCKKRNLEDRTGFDSGLFGGQDGVQQTLQRDDERRYQRRT